MQKSLLYPFLCIYSVKQVLMMNELLGDMK